MIEESREDVITSASNQLEVMPLEFNFMSSQVEIHGLASPNHLFEMKNERIASTTMMALLLNEYKSSKVILPLT